MEKTVDVRLRFGAGRRLEMAVGGPLRWGCCLIGQLSVWDELLLAGTTLVLLLLLQISVGIEVMVSGIPVCCDLTVITKKAF